jgi:hypothetical protein
MAVLEDKTGFASELVPFQDQHGQLYMIAIVRGTFDLLPGGGVRAAEVQEPVVLDDRYYGEPGKSSVMFASDLARFKPGTDVVMVGSAYAPGGVPASRVDVELTAGPVTKRAVVIGDREWTRRLGVLSVMTRPEPFLKMPLTYERAFGGSDTTHEDPAKHDWDRRNPVGRGFRVHRPLDATPLPNVEDPSDLIESPSDRPAPQGFGFVDRSWEPRLKLAGTYDERWQAEQLPLPPEDFDDRFFQAAHPDLVCTPHLRGDEPVRIVGAVPEGVVEFRLPGIAIGVGVHTRTDDPARGVALLDTVIIRPDERLINLVWRSVVPCRRKVSDLKRIVAFAVRLSTARDIMGESIVHEFGATTRS